GLFALNVDKTTIWRSDSFEGRDQRKGWFENVNSPGTWVNVTRLAAERLLGPTALVSKAAFERPNDDSDSQLHSLQLDELDMFRESRKKGTPSCTIGVGFGNEVDVKGENTFNFISIILSRKFNLSPTTFAPEDSEIGESPRYIFLNASTGHRCCSRNDVCSPTRSVAAYPSGLSSRLGPKSFYIHKGFTSSFPSKRRDRS
ncbi:hypothetical protein FRC19_004776, partial [Serendipita sp. 401]